MKKYKLPKMKQGGVAKDTHKTKDGKTAKKGLYYYMNRKKKKGTSNSKSKSTVSDKAYANMKAGFPKMRNGGVAGDPPKKSKQEKYVQKYYPIIKKVIKESGYNIDPSAVTTQLGIESNYATSGLTRKHNNFGGYSATKNDYDKGTYVSYETNEYLTDAETEKYKNSTSRSLVKKQDESVINEKGQVENLWKVKKGFKKFATPEEGLKKQIQLIANERYAKHGTTESKGNPLKYFQAVKAGGYATDVNYINTNMNTHNMLKKYYNKIDSNEKEVLRVQKLKDESKKFAESLDPNMFYSPSISTKQSPIIIPNRYGSVSFKYGGIVNNQSFCNCNYKKIK